VISDLEPELLVENEMANTKTSNIIKSWLEEIMRDSTESQNATVPQFTIRDADNCLEFLKGMAEQGVYELDLSSVDEIDTVGIQLLLAFQKKAAKSDAQLSLSNVSEEVFEIITSYNLKGRFLIN
jgi:ABC-type transporter Mla MlaB component